MRYFAVLAAVAVLMSCATPYVKYDVLKEKDVYGPTRFQLTDSMIKFDFAKNSMGNDDKSKLNITSVAFANVSTTYTLDGAPWYLNWCTTTQLTSTHVDGTLLLTQVQTSAVNQIGPALTTLGSIAATTLALTASGTIQPQNSAASLPIGINIRQFIKDAGTFKKYSSVELACDGYDRNGKKLQSIDRNLKIECKKVTLLSGDPQHPYTADITIEPVPIDAFKVGPLPFYSNSMIYSACRPVHIKVYPPAGSATTSTPTTQVVQNPSTLPSGGLPPVAPDIATSVTTAQEASLVVADSAWVQTTAFPPKGNIKLSTICGGDAVPASDYTPTSPLDLINTAMQAAKTASDALKNNAQTNGGSASGVTNKK